MRQFLLDIYSGLAKRITGRGLGLARLPGTSWLNNAVLTRLSSAELHTKVLGHRMYLNPADDKLTPHLLTFGTFDLSQTEMLGTIIRPGMRVIDAGANIGYFTLLAAKAVGNEGSVWAFEPEPDNFNLLIKNIEANGYTTVHAIPMALSNESSSRLFFTDRRSGVHGSFSSDNLWREGDGLQVSTTTLDDFARTEMDGALIDFIKVDIQGAEALFVEGAIDILRDQGPLVFMEYWPHGLRNLGADPIAHLRTLEELGYSMRLLEERHGNLRPITLPEIVELENAASTKADPAFFDLNILFEKTLRVRPPID